MTVRVNNYNTSTTGVDIELTVFRDLVAARLAFEDNFDLISDGLFWFGTQAMPERVTDCLDLAGVTEREARRWVVSRQLSGKWTTARDIVQERRDFYDSWLEYAEDVMADISIDDCVPDDFPCLGVERFTSVGVSSQCQSDYGVVLFDPSEFTEDFNPVQTFEQLLYDAPIYARVNVDGEDFYLDEDMKNVYAWDREEVTEIIQGWDIPDKAKAWIVSKLPEYPKYS